MPDRDILTAAESARDKTIAERDAEIERRVADATRMIDEDVTECYRERLEQLDKIIEDASNLVDAVVVVSRKPEARARDKDKAKTRKAPAKPARRPRRTRGAKVSTSTVRDVAKKLPPKPGTTLGNKIITWAEGIDAPEGWFAVTEEMASDLGVTPKAVRYEIRTKLVPNGRLESNGKPTKARRYRVAKRPRGFDRKTIAKQAKATGNGNGSTRPNTVAKGKPGTRNERLCEAIVEALGPAPLTRDELIGAVRSDRRIGTRTTEEEIVGELGKLYRENEVQSCRLGDKLHYKTRQTVMA